MMNRTLVFVNGVVVVEYPVNLSTSVSATRVGAIAWVIRHYTLTDRQADQLIRTDKVLVGSERIQLDYIGSVAKYKRIGD